MPVSVSFYRQFKGFAVAPEDIQPGDVDSIEIPVNRFGVQTKVSITRKSVVVTIRGIDGSAAEGFVTAADANRLSLARGSYTVENLDFGTFEVRDAYLIRATATPPITVAGKQIVEQLQLEYHSQKYT